MDRNNIILLVVLFLTFLLHRLVCGSTMQMEYLILAEIYYNGGELGFDFLRHRKEFKVVLFYCTSFNVFACGLLCSFTPKLWWWICQSIFEWRHRLISKFQSFNLNCNATKGTMPFFNCLGNVIRDDRNTMYLLWKQKLMMYEINVGAVPWLVWFRCTWM